MQLATLVRHAVRLASAGVLATAVAHPSRAQGPVPDHAVIQSAPVILAANYDPAEPPTCAGPSAQPDCVQTLFGVYYPAGSGPQALGYTNPPRPVFIQLRIGNGSVGPPQNYGWFLTNVLPKGFVGVDPNYPSVQPGQTYMDAAADVARLLQWLRHHHQWLNIDPDRIFVFGRSFGGIMALTVGLKGDFQDLGSADPVLHQSSRPNYILPFSALSDITCLGPQIQWNELYKLWFPVSSLPSATTQQKLDDSAVWWLMNPALYGRAFTPPMCLGYGAAAPGACGTIVDPHDPYFGAVLHEQTDALADQLNEYELGLSTTLIQAGDVWTFQVALDQALAWSVAQLAPKVESMYLIPPKTAITAAGSWQEFKVLGGLPGSPIAYFAALNTGPVVLNPCPYSGTGLLQALLLGFATPGADGKASFQAFAPPFVIGLGLYFHAFDMQACKFSNLLAKTWTE
ncbi:MAG: hypothetical protein FJ299_06465 [Planctomycetes bacterium]|nr:hypothetical protein [Planctomycetota bacterium]